jgi:hypothetical protein
LKTQSIEHINKWHNGNAGNDKRKQ